jgi:hypothetical protein
MLQVGIVCAILKMDNNLHVRSFERGRFSVATPLWVKCEDETHTPKSGNLESSETPENSELKFRGQNTLH